MTVKQTFICDGCKNVMKEMPPFQIEIMVRDSHTMAYLNKTQPAHFCEACAKEFRVDRSKWGVTYEKPMQVEEVLRALIREEIEGANNS